MYCSDKLEVIEVEYSYQLNELHKCIDRDGMFTGFKTVTPVTKDNLEDYILRANIVFLNVYYDSELTGYIVLDLKSTQTADFHWGVCNKNKYLMKIIEDAFRKCCEADIQTFIGWTPSDSKIALRVAKKMGFVPVLEIENYYSAGRAVTQSIFRNGGSNG